MRRFSHSIASKKPLINLFSLGEIYVSNFLKPHEQPQEKPCELTLAFDNESKMAQLTCQPNLDLMWGSMYWYRSGTNAFMTNALKNVAEQTLASIPPLRQQAIFLDIASNDGTLLSHLKDNNMIRIGMDCSDYPEASNHAELIIKDYFSASAYLRQAAKLAPDPRPYYVTCCAMFYDLDNPIEFLQNIYEVMHEEGVFVLQLSYTPLMLKQMELGNICHEHLGYYNLTSLQFVLSNSGFVIRDVEINNVNGGSIRVYCQKERADENRYKNVADRDIAKIRIESLLSWEEENGYNSPQVYLSFFDRINVLKQEVTSFIREAKKEGKRVWGYGASTKGNTLLQFFGLTSDDIQFIAEKQKVKHGLKTIGSNIPICSEEEMRKHKPDYLFVLPWHFISEFKEREKDYLKRGGKFIVPCPRFAIIEAD